MRTRFLGGGVLALSLVGVLLAGGCPESSLLDGLSGWLGNSGSSAGSGALRLLVTDAPYPLDLLESAEVTITRVEVFSAGSDDDEDDDEPDDGLDSDEAADEVDDDDPEASDEDFGDADDDEDLDAIDADELDDEQSAREGDDASADSAEDDADDDDDSAEHDDDDGDDVDNDAEDDDDDDGDEADGAGGWVVVFEGERAFDLLELRDGKTDLLADSDVPAGSYSMMRVYVSEGLVTLTDGRDFPLRVPSGDRSGIKLHFGFEIVAGDQTTLVLDIDLSRAFVPIPDGHLEDARQIERFQFRPSYAMTLMHSDDFDEADDDAADEIDDEGDELDDEAGDEAGDDDAEGQEADDDEFAGETDDDVQ